VLVVDDHRDTREMMELTLADEGLRVRRSRRPSALEAYASNPCDVALIDISMPGEDGYSCLQGLRGQAAQLGGRSPRSR
jgi:CheY-like chemotaxis protein